MGNYELEELDIQTEMISNLLTIPNYNELLKKLTEYLDNNCFKNLVIVDELDLKDVKKKRTSLNKLLNNVKRTRIDTLKVITGAFEEQLKSIENAIEETSKILSKNIKDYEELRKPKEEDNTPKIYTLSIYSFDKNQLKELKKLAKEQGLKAELKGGK